MKKNSLTTAVVASLAGIAGIANISNAVNLNPDGLGQVLLYPYFTVEKGNQTLISVVNTTNIGKAVKVRFLEGYNSREVLDFNLYLSPFDVWTAAIFDTKNGAGAPNSSTGPATLITRDNSCTVPTIIGRPGSSVDFRSFQYTGANNDSGPNTIERTREGYLEMIEMGSIPTTKFVDGALTNIPNGTFFASRHGASSGVPGGCGDISSAWATGINGEDLFNGVIGGTYEGSFGDLTIDQRDIAPPTGGLFGGGALVDTANGSYINYAAEAIDGFRTSANHTNPGELQPSLNNARGNAGAGPRSFVFNNGALVISEWRLADATGSNTDFGSAIDSVSAVLQSQVLSNEYATEASLNGASEWVITFPTKRFYVDPTYGAVPPTATGAVLPFRAAFTRRDADGAVVENNRGFACEALVLGLRDREERGPTGGSVDFSPLPPGAPASSLCFESQVVTFNQAGGTTPSKIFGSKLNLNIPATNGVGTANSGWATIDFGRLSNSSTATTRSMRPSVNRPADLASGNHQWRGLPAIGFWATSLENAAAQPGRLANYGGAFTHKRTRNCAVAPVAPATVPTGCAQF
jgi:hypothetical protein